MNARQSLQDKRNQRVAAILADHPAEVRTIPAFAEAAAELRRQLDLVPAAVAQQGSSRQRPGATRTKNDLEAPLIKQLVKAAAALSLLYKKTGRLDLAQALHLRPSEYEKMTEPAFALEAQAVADQVTSHAPDLAHYGYKPATSTDPSDAARLQAQVAAYAASLPGAGLARSAGKVGTGTVRTVFKDLSAYLDGDFRSAVELLADDHQDLYKLLREALRIDDTGAGGRKRKKGMIEQEPGGAKPVA